MTGHTSRSLPTVHELLVTVGQGSQLTWRGGAHGSCGVKGLAWGLHREVGLVAPQQGDRSGQYSRTAGRGLARFRVLGL